MKKFISLIGFPVAHSISPYFQQAALDHFHLDIEYRVREIYPEKLAETINSLRQGEHVGANITVPYKEKVLPFLDEIDDMAKAVGAVNTIVKRGDCLAGYNTDIHGFLTALRREGNFDPAGKTLAVLGAGGAARAVSFALISQKAKFLKIINRSLKRAEDMAASLRIYMGKTGLQSKISVLPWESTAAEQTFKDTQLIVNCTTAGTIHTSQQGISPLSARVIPAGILVYDLVYNPPMPPFLRIARAAGANILGGLPMLVYQGAAAFTLWVEKEAPLDIMFYSAAEALNA